MGLDITVTERKEVRCPLCGTAITSLDVSITDSSGRVWYNFLEKIGYYVPYEKRTKENDWYGKDMILDDEQAKRLANYSVEKEVYNSGDIVRLVRNAFLQGHEVVINADW